MPYAYTAWVYKAKKSTGVLTKEAIEIMRAAEATILDDEKYEEYCQLVYKSDEETSNECKRPLTAMNAFYASEWITSDAQDVISELKDMGKVELFNKLTLCLEYDDLCEEDDIETEENMEWAQGLNSKINSIIENWDGAGSLNSDIEEVTEFMAYMNALTSKQFNVAYFFDENFSVDNPISMHARSLLNYGSNSNDLDADSEDKKLLYDSKCVYYL